MTGAALAETAVRTVVNLVSGIHSRRNRGYTPPTLSLPQPDLGVLRKAQRGDERAFSLIVRAYETPVFNYVLRLVGDRSLAEDLTQEVFLRVYQGLPKFSLRCKFTTWLFQVTKNRVLDELRASERRPRHLVALDDIPPLEALDAPIERGETVDALWRAIEDLSVDLKMALLLRDVDGPLLHGDRRLARDHARDRQVADLQGPRGGRARARPRGHHLRRRRTAEDRYGRRALGSRHAVQLGEQLLLERCRDLAPVDRGDRGADQPAAVVRVREPLELQGGQHRQPLRPPPQPATASRAALHAVS